MNEYQYLTSKQVVESPRYPFTEGQVRDLLTKRHKNGVSKIIRKVGKRIYWRSDLLDLWLESQCCKGGQS